MERLQDTGVIQYDIFRKRLSVRLRFFFVSQVCKQKKNES